jgi:hypothetical protein
MIMRRILIIIAGLAALLLFGCGPSARVVNNSFYDITKATYGDITWNGITADHQSVAKTVPTGTHDFTVIFNGISPATYQIDSGISFFYGFARIFNNKVYFDVFSTTATIEPDIGIISLPVAGN